MCVTPPRILPVTKMERPIKGGASKNLNFHFSSMKCFSQFHSNVPTRQTARALIRVTLRPTFLRSSFDTEFDFFWTSFIFFSLKELWLHTSNSSQNPCFGFSELSATLLSSRTRFSMLAAFILVALKGWLTRQEKEMQ